MSEALEAEIIEPEEASELTVAYSPAVIEANFDALEAHVRRLVPTTRARPTTWARTRT